MVIIEYFLLLTIKRMNSNFFGVTENDLMSIYQDSFLFSSFYVLLIQCSILLVVSRNFSVVLIDMITYFLKY